MSAEMAQKARAAMKQKAERMTRADPHQKVDASSWTPGESMNADAQTGMRPISKRQFRRGGKVHGEKAEHRVDRKPRKSGGRAMADDYVNRDVRAANAEIAKPHIGGFAAGGGTNFRKSMHADAAEDKRLIKHMVKDSALRSRKRNGGGQWIQSAIKHPGALHEELHVKKGEKIPAKKLEKAEHSDNPKLAKRAHLAETLKKLHRKHGGRTGKDTGGGLSDILDAQQAAKAGNMRAQTVDAAKADNSPKTFMVEQPTGQGGDGAMKRGGTAEGNRPKGGRMPRKSGGRTKGKTNISIVIAQPSGQQQPQQPPMMPPRPPQGVPVPPPQPPQGMPPGGAPGMGLSGGQPPMPMPRKAGGKVEFPTIAKAKRARSYKDMDASAMGGLGRIQKEAIAEKTYARAK